jgi:hypothetical protein
MFRSEATDTRMGSGSTVEFEEQTLCDGVSINIKVTPLSGRSLSKIAHIRSDSTHTKKPGEVHVRDLAGLTMLG